MDKSFLQNITILYVEDEDEVRDLTSNFLAKFVHKIIPAQNGKEGLELFQQYHENSELDNIDLIVTDINMPKMNGLDMLLEIGKIDHLIPSIVTTAHNDASFLKEAINQRVRGYVSKPLNMHDLIDSILVVSEPVYLKAKLEKLNNELKLKVEKKTYELQSILDAQDNLILVITGDGTIDVNQTLLDFFGYKSSKDFALNHSCISDLFLDKNSYFVKKDSDNWLEDIMKLEDSNRVVLMKNLKGEEIIFRVNVKSFMFHTQHWVISFTDITDLKNYTYELQYKATHDNLTKLYNRQKLNDELDKEIVRENRYKHGLSILMLDIDNFKNINDTYGHDVGDVVLKDISKIILESIRATDYACRWGGEEFMVLLPETTVEQAFKIAENIRINIENYINPVLPNKTTVSIGVVEFQRDKDDIETFVKNVDLAMYQAKKTGKNRVVKYEK
ncbi:MAG: diguanylate cyclase [Arcobacteraceae bacterium]